jgi:hypothetical protein
MTTSNDTSGLRLKPGVSLVEVDGEGVLMDLAAGDYVGLNSASTQIWKAKAEGLSSDEISQELAMSRGLSTEDARGLVRKQLEDWQRLGLVGMVDENSMRAVLPRFKASGSPATQELDRQRLAETPLTVRSGLSLLRARIWARGTLRKHNVSGALKRLQDLPARDMAHAEREETLYRWRRAYAAFRRLWQQGVPRNCLPNSIALASALRRQGVDAEVCMGVEKFPFWAHAWVEAQGTVINDTVAAVGKYAVIGRF